MVAQQIKGFVNFVANSEFGKSVSNKLNEISGFTGITNFNGRDIKKECLDYCVLGRQTTTAKVVGEFSNLTNCFAGIAGGALVVDGLLSLRSLKKNAFIKLPLGAALATQNTLPLPFKIAVAGLGGAGALTFFLLSSCCRKSPTSPDKTKIAKVKTK